LFEVQFNALAITTGTKVYEFSVLAAFLLLTPNRTDLVQPWSDGKILFREKDHNPEERYSAAETLAAFTHFTYEFSNKRLIMTMFEGHQTSNGQLVIFDSKTHTAPDLDIEVTEDGEYQGQGNYYLGNQKAVGIQSFIQRHRTCNPVCRGLGLAPLSQS
jgi:hypothetical protein